MGGKATIPQTQWTKAGRDISNTSVPLYQTNLKELDARTTDPQSYIDSYLNKYYSNTSDQSDFLRNYQRSMGNVMANNYTNTGGAYSSSGQRAINDAQRGWNDLGSRLQDYGVTSAYNMANQDVNNLINANSSFYNAYNLGKAYSDTERYNAVVNQGSMNPFGEILQGVGSIISTVAPGVGTVIGGGLSMLGKGMQVDTSIAPALIGANVSSPQGGTSASGNSYANILKGALDSWGEYKNRGGSASGILGGIANAARSVGNTFTGNLSTNTMTSANRSGQTNAMRGYA